MIEHVAFEQADSDLWMFTTTARFDVTGNSERLTKTAIRPPITIEIVLYANMCSLLARVPQTSSAGVFGLKVHVVSTMNVMPIMNTEYR